ncbi:MAG: aspartate kinase [Coriobacteriales bacterium]|jgi:aspartate kinase|nr:aspartate kinase [Coriobacteriales bacterium]
MSIIVCKFGGTSLANPERVLRAARRLVDYRQAGHEVVAVVSAMGKTTDDLVALAEAVSPKPPLREMDMLLATGEQQSMAVMAMAIQGLGQRAVSMTGRQAGIITTAAYSKAQIDQIKCERVTDALAKDEIVIVAGFQGVTRKGDITTLGRGGSDTTAVALAAALHADLCEIYSDVDGVYTADPRKVPRAHKLERLSYKEMLEIAAAGSGVLALRAVEFARRYQVPVSCRSAFNDNPGTIISAYKEDPMEQAVVSSVTYDNSEAKITIRDVPDNVGIAAQVFSAIAKVGANVDMIVQNVSEDGHTDMSFTTPIKELDLIEPVLKAQVKALGAREYGIDRDIAKISIIGAGMKANPGVAAKMFKVLADNGVNIGMISTSAIRVSVTVRSENIERALTSLHTAFGLDADEEYEETQLTAAELAAKAQKGR